MSRSQITGAGTGQWSKNEVKEEMVEMIFTTKKTKAGSILDRPAAQPIF